MTLYTESAIPPQNFHALSTPEQLKDKLQPLIGRRFPLTRKPRTDGNRFLHLVVDTLMADNPPAPAEPGTYNIVPPKKKGVPKFLREYVDTYIITSGENYNLQVWNRNPDTDMIQVEYAENGDNLTSHDVRFVLAKINMETETIESIFITSPHSIVERFGAFGVPTSKQQLIISKTAKHLVMTTPDNIALFNDEASIGHRLQINARSSSNFRDLPTQSTKIMPLSQIKGLVSDLVGKPIVGDSTRVRGLELEKSIVQHLGYKIPDAMYSQYPDIPNQMLEVKVQDSPTVDLGKFSPQDCRAIHAEFTTQNTRYLIAITNPSTGIVDAIFLGPGSSLKNYFSFVPDSSVKYQRGIRMLNFRNHAGEIVLWE